MEFSSNPYFFRDGLPIKASFFVGFFEGDAHLVETLLTLFQTPLTLFQTPLTLVETLRTLVEIPLTLVETPLTLVETPLTLVETPLTLFQILLTLVEIPLTLFQTPCNLFFGGLGGVGRKGREATTNGRGAATNGRGSGRKRGTFCDGMGQKIPPRGGEAGRRGGFGEGSSAKKIPARRGSRQERRHWGREFGKKNPRGAGKWDGGAALGKGVRQKKSPRGGDVELFGGVVYNLYPREMSPARFLAPSSENLSTPKSASMPRVNPEGNWYPTMACMPASKRFTPLRLKVFSS